MHRTLQIGSRLSLGFLSLFLLLTCTPLELWWLRALESSWASTAPETLLVLGAEEQAPGLIGYSTYLRLNYAVRYWRLGQTKRFVVSAGPQTPASPPLALSMKEFLVASGVPPAAILLETAAHNTYQNIAFSKTLLDSLAGSKGLLTSDFHSGRAARTARRHGLALIPVPVPDIGKRWQLWQNRWPIAIELTIESAKWLYYASRGEL